MSSGWPISRSPNPSASDVRPVLVLWLDGLDAVVAAVSTAARQTAMDVPLADWAAAGLRKASTVRLSRLDCLEQTLLFRTLGQLSAADAGRIRAAWDAYVKPQF